MSQRVANPLVRQPRLFDIRDEPSLLAACLALGARTVGSWTPAEQHLTEKLPPIARSIVADLRLRIESGEDPLGDLFGFLRPPVVRRELGATYTPLSIVRAMIERLREAGIPDRVVDPGTGSGRYLMEAGRTFEHAELVGFELDPVATILAKANLAVAGFADRSRILLANYLTAPLPECGGRTLFTGNPPYVRHHRLPPEWKEWLVDRAAALGYRASQLAGLHVYFFLATVLKSRGGDFGAFITAAEWLDVNYGSLLRQLFVDDLGGSSITVLEPTAMPFPDAATTSVVTAFGFGTKNDTVAFARIDDPSKIVKPDAVRYVRRERLETERRWSHLTRGTRDVPSDYVELGELCRVHRGAVTGANRVWIAGDHSRGLPQSLLFPTVTRAKEIIVSSHELSDASKLRCVIDLPEDLDQLGQEERQSVETFLRAARQMGADAGYIARNRKTWWSVGLRTPAPILATYMARRPPSFARNKAAARHLNIAHGLYPREPLGEPILQALVRFLSHSVSVHDGRTYAGGLTKFEPREMERLLVPRPEQLSGYTS